MPENILDDSPHEECGVLGIYAPGRDVARLTFFGLYALQHRGLRRGIAALCLGGGEAVALAVEMES